jgi:FKBP-type peptidyl-prolyl cis-trans isomerase FkpA
MLRTGMAPSRLRLVLILALATAACGGGTDTPTSPSTPAATFAQTDLVVGSGAEATAGRTVTVHYTGWLYDPAQPENKGRQFETSRGRSPFAFVLGAGRVIAGWDRGVVGMRVGGQRRLILPPDLAYGRTGSSDGTIPPNASLVFDVEVLDVQ